MGKLYRRHVARTLGISPNAVDVRLARARQRRAQGLPSGRPYLALPEPDGRDTKGQWWRPGTVAAYVADAPHRKHRFRTDVEPEPGPVFCRPTTAFGLVVHEPAPDGRSPDCGIPLAGTVYYTDAPANCTLCLGWRRTT